MSNREMMSFRIDKKVKRQLKELADREHRSMSNMIERLIDEEYRRQQEQTRP